MHADTDPAIDSPDRRERARRLLFSRPVLLLAFAFAVMADPVSSVAYAIEAAPRCTVTSLCCYRRWDWSSR